METTNRIVLYSLFLAVTAVSCKCKPKQKAAASVDTPTQSQVITTTQITSTASKTAGKISHKYKATGCSTVIIVNDGQEVLTLIPRGKLPADLDIDGQEVTFDYRTLKMPQPEGCSIGIPAEIKGIAKK